MKRLSPPSTSRAYYYCTTTTTTSSPLFPILLILFTIVLSDHHFTEAHIDNLKDAVIYHSVQDSNNYFSEIVAPSNFDFRARHYANLFLPPPSTTTMRRYHDYFNFNHYDYYDDNNGDNVDENYNVYNTYMHEDLCDISSVVGVNDNPQRGLFEEQPETEKEIVSSSVKMWPFSHHPSKNHPSFESITTTMKPEKYEYPNNNAHSSNVDHVLKTTPPRISSTSTRVVQRSTRESWWTETILDIALLVYNSPNCTLEQKARNAMKLNEFYRVDGNHNYNSNRMNHKYNIPIIKYMLVYNPQHSIANDEKIHNTPSSQDQQSTSNSTNTTISDDVTEDNDPKNEQEEESSSNSSINYKEELEKVNNHHEIDIHILQISPNHVMPIITNIFLLQQTNYNNDNHQNSPPAFYLHQDAFYKLDNPKRNPWSYNILFMQIGTSAHTHLYEWKWIYVIVTIILSLPILRACCTIYFADRRIVIDRNESTNRIIGFHIVRLYRHGGGLVDDHGNLADFPIHLKETLTKRQVDTLPIVKYGVSDLKKVVKKYHRDRESNPWLMAEYDENVNPNIVDVEEEVGGRDDSLNMDNNTGNDCIDGGGDEEQHYNEVNLYVEEEGSDQEMSTIDKNINDDDDEKQASLKSDDHDDEEEKCEEVNESYQLVQTSPEEDAESSISSDMDKCSFISRAYIGCDSCHICLAEYDKGQSLVLLPRCGHLFHYDCILPWLTEYKHHCPSCKLEVIQYEQNDTASMVVLP